jgi:hypothetical protein
MSLRFLSRRLTLRRRDLILRQRRVVATEETLERTVDPAASPFALPPIEGLPFNRDSEEALAIRKVIEDADRERGQTGNEAT